MTKKLILIFGGVSVCALLVYCGLTYKVTSLLGVVPLIKNKVISMFSSDLRPKDYERLAPSIPNQQRIAQQVRQASAQSIEEVQRTLKTIEEINRINRNNEQIQRQLRQQNKK